MFLAHGRPPPLTPILLAGLIARPLPPQILQPILDALFALLRRRHPELFERLSGLGAPVFLIDPTDLPLIFELDANPDRPRLTAARVGGERAVATIRGPLLALIELLEGRVDGDALFFSRTLAIEGDTEAVVALRNAVDDAGIDLRRELLDALGPLAPPARHALGLGQWIYARLNDDLELLRAAARATPAKGLDT